MNREVTQTIHAYILSAILYAAWLLFLPFIITFLISVILLSVLLFMWDSMINFLPLSTKNKRFFVLRKF